MQLQPQCRQSTVDFSNCLWTFVPDKDSLAHAMQEWTRQLDSQQLTNPQCYLHATLQAQTSTRLQPPRLSEHSQQWPFVTFGGCVELLHPQSLGCHCTTILPIQPTTYYSLHHQDNQFPDLRLNTATR
jgi:hypothetical protein